MLVKNSMLIIKFYSTTLKPSSAKPMSSSDDNEKS